MLAFLAVAIGGLVGTGLRLACDLAFPHADGELPVETLVVNLVGAFALGWLVGGLWTRPTTPFWLKAGLGSGLLGSFTTLSAVMASLLPQILYRLRNQLRVALTLFTELVQCCERDALGVDFEMTTQCSATFAAAHAICS